MFNQRVWSSAKHPEGATPLYRTIVADPPWEYEAFAKVWPAKYSLRDDHALPYKSLPVHAISELPVRDLAAPDAAVFLWTTNRYLHDAFHVLDAWGFTYRQCLIWDKPNPPPWGGAIAPNSCEFLLFARTNAWRGTGRMPSAIIRALKGGQQHSRKPEAMFDLVEQVSPGPYLELFARRQRLGWDTWGDEALEHVSLEQLGDVT